MHATRSIVLSAAAVAAVLAASGCGSAPEPEPEPSPSAPESASASPSPSPTPSASAAPYDDPGTPEGSIARAEIAMVDGVPQMSITALAPVVAGQTFVVEGQCTGGERMDFRVDRAIAGDADERLLVQGTIDCDAPAVENFSYSLPYDGLVQLSLAADEDVTMAWALVRAEG
ncbi:hypothetical protein [Agrococcus sp. SGAir0287]|uniref:hypothetical protein n=1 Tax=Agrococcus sp. SGAir0287 TaxID=2070347 RepID=UPI0015869F73|nr:hypothetical protein [Agrococcus sp. SGAir0287]